MMTEKERLKKEVLVLLDKDGRVYQVGVPEHVNYLDIKHCLKAGNTFKTVTFKKYLKMKWSKIYGYSKD